MSITRVYTKSLSDDDDDDDGEGQLFEYWKKYHKNGNLNKRGNVKRKLNNVGHNIYNNHRSAIYNTLTSYLPTHPRRLHLLIYFHRFYHLIPHRLGSKHSCLCHTSPYVSRVKIAFLLLKNNVYFSIHQRTLQHRVNNSIPKSILVTRYISQNLFYLLRVISTRL